MPRIRGRDGIIHGRAREGWNQQRRALWDAREIWKDPHYPKHSSPLANYVESVDGDSSLKGVDLSWMDEDLQLERPQNPRLSARRRSINRAMPPPPPPPPSPARPISPRPTLRLLNSGPPPAVTEQEKEKDEDEDDDDDDDDEDEDSDNDYFEKEGTPSPPGLDSSSNNEEVSSAADTTDTTTVTSPRTLQTPFSHPSNAHPMLDPRLTTYPPISNPLTASISLQRVVGNTSPFSNAVGNPILHANPSKARSRDSYFYITRYRSQKRFRRIAKQIQVSMLHQPQHVRDELLEMLKTCLFHMMHGLRRMYKIAIRLGKRGRKVMKRELVRRQAVLRKRAIESVRVEAKGMGLRRRGKSEVDGERLKEVARMAVSLAS